MRFKYHMYGADIGSLAVYKNNEPLWRQQGDHGNQWLQGNVFIDCNNTFYQVNIL